MLVITLNHGNDVFRLGFRLSVNRFRVLRVRNVHSVSLLYRRFCGGNLNEQIVHVLHVGYSRLRNDKFGIALGDVHAANRAMIPLRVIPLHVEVVTARDRDGTLLLVVHLVKVKLTDAVFQGIFYDLRQCLVILVYGNDLRHGNGRVNLALNQFVGDVTYVDRVLRHVLCTVWIAVYRPRSTINGFPLLHKLQIVTIRKLRLVILALPLFQFCAFFRLCHLVHHLSPKLHSIGSPYFCSRYRLSSSLAFSQSSSRSAVHVFFRSAFVFSSAEMVQYTQKHLSESTSCVKS